MHTYITLREAEGLDELSEDARALDTGAIHAIAFHDPKRLKEERIRLQRRVRTMSDKLGAHRQAALQQGQQIIERVKMIGGPKSDG